MRATHAARERSSPLMRCCVFKMGMRVKVGHAFCSHDSRWRGEYSHCVARATIEAEARATGRGRVGGADPGNDRESSLKTQPILAVAVGAVLLLLPACSPVENAAPTPTPLPTSTAEPVTVNNLQEVGAVIVASPNSSEAAPANNVYVVTFDAAKVVERVMPAVVTVVNEQRFNDGSFGGTEIEAGRGTGFAVDNAGNIVTNEHVVRGGNQFAVILANGEKHDATLVGADPLSDLAVVRIDGAPPAFVAFGDSDALQQGQPVLAIGSPLGEFTGTVTSGIISALNRDFPDAAEFGAEGEGAYSDLIQHDAAINPGNSGGPLFDLAGRVIGVNTLGIPQSGSTPVQGLFFAIPSNHVARIVGELIDSGKVAYPFMGVSYAPITPDVAAQNDLPVDYGAYVQSVAPGGPADQAGIRENDIIVAIGERRIDQSTSFSKALFAHAPGETVSVTVQRNGQQQEFDVTLATRPRQP
jgi:2-alkenal reductase